MYITYTFIASYISYTYPINILNYIHTHINMSVDGQSRRDDDELRLGNGRTANQIYERSNHLAPLASSGSFRSIIVLFYL